MILASINLTNFKNYEQIQTNFHPKMNIISGLNGSGKTNLLDAIYYLCFCKSYFQTSDAQNILHQENFFRLESVFQPKGEEDAVSISQAYQKRSKKVVQRNRVTYTNLTEHIGFCPLILIAPDDIQLINAGSTERRKLIDTTLSQFNRTYLEYLIHYNRNLQQRNALLKSFAANNTFDGALLETYDEELRKSAPLIHQNRLELMEMLNPIFQKFYRQLSNEQETVSLRYKSSLLEMDFAQILAKNRQKDCLLQRTSDGIHRDDLVFRIGEYPLKKLGSQGQKKSFLIALKLAFYQLIQQKKEMLPLLLLDDIFDKLDRQRTQQLLELVTQDSFGQIFITDTQLERLQHILQTLKLPFKHFEIQKGKIIAEKEF